MLRQCQAYIEASKLFSDPADCKSSLTEVVEFIDESIHAKTSRAKSLSGCQIKDRTTSIPIMKLKSSQEIVEIPKEKFTRIIGYYEEEIAGSYHPKTGRIFLVEGKWCFSNLIHESLHSRSVFSKRDPPPKNLEFVSEGLTELLVGIVLKRKIPVCYEKWRIVNSCFLSPYEKFVKPWYYIMCKSDLAPIISLYFNVEEQNQLEKLGKLLQQLISSQFENVFLNYDPTERKLFDRFLDQLGKIFPTDFAEFQGSPLTKIKLDHLNS
jgi:hypothetical protein